jgi:hypothetical protein
MRFMSRLASTASQGDARSGNGTLQYESTLSIRSNAAPGVTFVIHRISFGRRMELSRRVRELSRRAEYLEAGAEVQEKIEAGILAQEIDAMYLRWGLVSVQGMTIDGEPAECERLIEKGPEALVGEIVRAVKSQCGLSEAEIKN